MVSFWKKREKNENNQNNIKWRRNYKKRGPSWTDWVLILALAGGLCLVAYPTASDWWNSMHAYQTIADYSAKIEGMSEEEKDAVFAAAESYNSKLPNGTDFALSSDEMDEYMSLLDVTGNGVMGYIQIPSININLPVYHTVEEDVLQTAVGHIPGTSLPVGGERTHAVISGHRGLPSAKLFTDLNKLSEGDLFMMTVLDRTFTYQIDQIRIVLPEETEDLAIQPGRDYFTLVTCTPYGVNSHRMLVRGVRTDNLEGAVTVDPDATKIPGYVIMPFIAVPMLVMALLAMILIGRMERRRRSKSRMLEDIRNNGIDLEDNKIIKEECDHDGKET